MCSQHSIYNNLAKQVVPVLHTWRKVTFQDDQAVHRIVPFGAKSMPLLNTLLALILYLD